MSTTHPSLADATITDTKATLTMSLHDIMGNLPQSHDDSSTASLSKHTRELSVDIPPPVYSAVSPGSEHSALALERQLQDAHDAAQLLSQHLHDAEDEALAAMNDVRKRAEAAEARAREAERAVLVAEARAAELEARLQKAETRAEAAEGRVRDKEEYAQGLEIIISKLCGSIDEHVTGFPPTKRRAA